MKWQALLALVPLAVALAAVPAHAARPCPPDLDCSGDVAVGDLLDLLADWGASGTLTDLDQSGFVDVNDLLMMLAAWGPCGFDFLPPFENGEAEQIAYEMLGPGGPLVPNESDYDRIVRDLDLIRAEFPLLEPQTHTPAWAPNRLIVQVLQGVPRDEYECLNAFYGVTDENLLFSFGGAGDVTLISFEEFGALWCEFKQ